jgi:hypothetical protein
MADSYQSEETERFDTKATFLHDSPLRRGGERSKGMRRLRLLVVAAVAAGVMAVAPAAQADDSCFGAEGILVVCAELTTIYTTCVYAGGDTCTPVSVPGPEVTRCEGGDSDKALLPIIVRAACGVIV